MPGEATALTKMGGTWYKKSARRVVAQNRQNKRRPYICESAYPRMTQARSVAVVSVMEVAACPSVCPIRSCRLRSSKLDQSFLFHSQTNIGQSDKLGSPSSNEKKAIVDADAESEKWDQDEHEDQVCAQPQWNSESWDDAQSHLDP